MVEIAKIRKWDILGDFQSTCNTQFSMSLKNDIFAYCVVSIRVIKWYSICLKKVLSEEETHLEKDTSHLEMPSEENM